VLKKLDFYFGVKLAEVHFLIFFFLAIPPQGPNLNIDRQTGSGLTAAAIDAAARKLSQLLLRVFWVCVLNDQISSVAHLSL
jgi:hypothetical protein